MMRGMFRRKLKDFAEMQKENKENVSLLDRFKQGAGEKIPSRQNQYLSDVDKPVFIDIEPEYEIGSLDDFRCANTSMPSFGNKQII